jgi:hypothetical protein
MGRLGWGLRNHESRAKCVCSAPQRLDLYLYSASQYIYIYQITSACSPRRLAGLAPSHGSRPTGRGPPAAWAWALGRATCHTPHVTCHVPRATGGVDFAHSPHPNPVWLVLGGAVAVVH